MIWTVLFGLLVLLPLSLVRLLAFLVLPPKLYDRAWRACRFACRLGVHCRELDLKRTPGLFSWPWKCHRCGATGVEWTV